jgi:hypothetical protein
MISASEPGIVALLHGIPPWNSREFTYVGSTNNVESVTYFKDSTEVATVSYTYVNAGAADNDKVATETVALV